MCTFNSFMASAKSFASGLKHNQNGRGRNGNLFEHVKAARPNGSGIFEHPRQMHISLGTFTSLGNLPNLKVSKKVWVVTCSDGPWWVFYQKTMPKKNDSVTSYKSESHSIHWSLSLGFSATSGTFCLQSSRKINRGILALISWSFIFAWRSFQLVLWTSRPGPVCVQSRTWDSQPSRKPGHIPISYFWAMHRWGLVTSEKVNNREFSKIVCTKDCYD